MSGGVPERGDVIWITMSPQVGREQMVRRPALVLSPGFYNSASGLVVMCPITSRVKGYPFEVRIPEELPVHGVILADQIKSLDWQERKADFVCTVPGAILRQVRATLDRLLEGPASP